MDDLITERSFDSHATRVTNGSFVLLVTSRCLFNQALADVSGQLWRNKTYVLYQLGDACISRDVLWDEDYNIHSSDKVSWCTGLLVLKLAGQLKLRESED